MGDNCKNYVEIGTLWGGSICSLLNLNNTSTTYTGIDLFLGYYGSELTEENILNALSEASKKHLLWEFNNVGNVKITIDNHKSFVDHTIKMYNSNKNKINLIQGSSYSDSTLAMFKKLVNKIDLLFIDGDHSIEVVQKDFMKYNEFININGIIIFDNYGDPNWTGVKTGVDSIDFGKYNFKTVGQFGYSLVIIKL